MKQRLYQKLQKSEPYTREELLWFLKNIGHPEAEIRDDLVYASFCHALLDGLVSKSDFRWLADKVTQRHLLFFSHGYNWFSDSNTFLHGFIDGASNWIRWR
ncbi:hypothetical protein [Streptococcus pluranimalium]|uniref:hypothetical protein n=1 Tax=Streptococcus pluranimalium TaxID=82348 RepID=UPI003F669378